jgi:hypothetical protein
MKHGLNTEGKLSASSFFVIRVQSVFHPWLALDFAPRMARMRRLVLFLMGWLSLAAGCRRADLVEAELRTRERELRETRSELDRSELYNHALQSEMGDLRKSGPGHPSCSNALSPLTPERASQIYTLKEIVLGRLTGGYDDDNIPGDEALQVILEPRDPDGQAIKAPGHLTVTAMQICQEGLKTPLSTWDISPDQLRRTWRNGLLSTGYYVVLPWKIWPTTSKLRVIAQFTLADGRVFEADKDVTIRLAPNLRGLIPGSPIHTVPPRMPPADAPLTNTIEPELAAPAPREIGKREIRPSPVPSVESVSAWKKAPPPAGSGIQILQPGRNP